MYWCEIIFILTSLILWNWSRNFKIFYFTNDILTIEHTRNPTFAKFFYYFCNTITLTFLKSHIIVDSISLKFLTTMFVSKFKELILKVGGIVWNFCLFHIPNNPKIFVKHIMLVHKNVVVWRRWTKFNQLPSKYFKENYRFCLRFLLEMLLYKIVWKSFLIGFHAKIQRPENF